MGSASIVFKQYLKEHLWARSSLACDKIIRATIFSMVVFVQIDFYPAIAIQFRDNRTKYESHYLKSLMLGAYNGVNSRY